MYICLVDTIRQEKKSKKGAKKKKVKSKAGIYGGLCILFLARQDSIDTCLSWWKNMLDEATSTYQYH